MLLLALAVVTLVAVAVERLLLEQLRLDLPAQLEMVEQVLQHQLQVHQHLTVAVVVEVLETRLIITDLVDQEAVVVALVRVYVEMQEQQTLVEAVVESVMLVVLQLQD